MKTFDDDVRDFITAQIENVELDGLCPICGTGRSQNGECWRGHIVINVRRPTQPALDGGNSPLEDSPFETGVRRGAVVIPPAAGKA